MKQNIWSTQAKFLVFLSALLICLFCFLLLLSLRKDNPEIREADQAYLAGEGAKDIGERKMAFNQALARYLNLETQYNPRFGNGKLYYNIANTFFQLGEYPWAILYYERAHALMPRQQQIEENLHIALKKLFLNQASTSSPFAQVFFFHHLLSLPEKIQLFFLLSLVAIFCASLKLWTSYRFLKFFWITSLVLLICILLSIGYTKYFSPVGAILIHSVDLRKDAGEQYAKVAELPLPAGTRVEVIGLDPMGNWLKVSMPNGNIGYVPQESIRLIGP